MNAQSIINFISKWFAIGTVLAFGLAFGGWLLHVVPIPHVAVN